MARTRKPKQLESGPKPQVSGANSRFTQSRGSVKNGLRARIRRAGDRMEVLLSERVSAMNRSGRTTLGSFFLAWLERKVRQGLKSERDYRSLIRNHFEPSKPRARLTPSGLPALGSRQLQHLKVRVVRLWLDELRSSQLAPRSQRNVFALLRNVLADAKRRGLIKVNPCDEIDKRQELPKARDVDPTFRKTGVFTRAEASAILAAEAIPIRWHALWAFLFLTGCRVGEALALAWGVIDWDRPPLAEISLQRAYNSKSGRITTTKTDAIKDVPMHPTLRPFLEEWKERYREVTGSLPGPDTLVFPSVKSCMTPMRSSTVLQRLHADLRALGMRQRATHNIRATFITLVTDDECNPVWMQMVTHARPTDVKGGYERPPWKSLCREMEKLKL